MPSLLAPVAAAVVNAPTYGAAAAVPETPSAAPTGGLRETLLSMLPDSVGYVARHKVLGFEVADGIRVVGRKEIDDKWGWLTSWSAIRIGSVLTQDHWGFSLGLSPYLTTYSLRHEYEFRLQDRSTGVEYLSTYRIEAFQAYALAKAAATWRIPGGAIEAGLLAGPSYVWWEDSKGVFGRKLQVTWGPSLAAVAFLPWDAFVRGAWEVFSISRSRAIGTSAYQVRSYQVSSLMLGYRFR